MNPSKHIFTNYLKYEINGKKIEIVPKNDLSIKDKKICEDTIKILNLNERRLVEYRFNLYIMYFKKKMQLDYLQIHPVLFNFLKTLPKF